VVQQYGVDGLTIATIMAGFMLVGFGLVRLGAAIKFIPFPVTTGFTSGIAVVIASGQVADLLGLSIPGSVPAEFLHRWRVYAAHIESINPHALVVAGLTLAVLILWPHVSRRVPAPFVAIIAAALAVPVLGLDVETIGTRFGELRMGLPRPAVPAVSMALVRDLLPAAFTIALLGAVESLLSAVVADGMVGTRHRSNVELVGQGIANIVTPIFGGMPATGAIARTATNVRSGGRTPVAGMVHAVAIALMLLFAARWIGHIPLAGLAAILLVVAYHMSEWRTFLGEFSGPRSDVAVLLTTFLLTVLVDITLAIEAGMVLAAFLFMRRMAEVTNVTALRRELSDGEGAGGTNGIPDLPPGVLVYEINGPFFFGAAEKFKETVGTIADAPRVLILRMRNVSAMDSTGMNALRQLVRRLRSDGTLVLLAEVHAQPLVALGRSYLLDEIGEEHMFGSLADALERAAQHTPAQPA
jgi:sulfate permease, SulP family